MKHLIATAVTGAALIVPAGTALARPIDQPLAKAPVAASRPDPRSPDAKDAARHSALATAHFEGATALHDTYAGDVRATNVPSSSLGVLPPAKARTDMRSPDARDAARLAERPRWTAHPATVKPPSATPAASDSSFDWGDAGIGAGSMAALLMLALGGTTLVLRRRSLTH